MAGCACWGLGAESIPELRLLVTPDAAIVPIATTESAPFTIYQVASLHGLFGGRFD
jgi:hypothetical protein